MPNDVVLVGTPAGPPVLVPQFGCEVPTFTDEQTPPHSEDKTPHLKWHVPLNFRGEFRPDQLADYDPTPTADGSPRYRTDIYGFMLCYSQIKSGSRFCKNRAVHRFSRCEMHGGRLHPLDRILKQEPDLSTEQAKSTDPQALSRYRQYINGALSLDDLEDEELVQQGFRTSNGGIFKPRNVPREMAHAFTKAIYDRAHREFRSNAIQAAATMAEIMTDKSNDPEVRLKAAKEIIERNLGRTPQVVAITGSAPWEEIFDGIASGTREDSRRDRQRVIASRPETSDDAPIDVDTVDESYAAGANAQGDSGFGSLGLQDPDERNAANTNDFERSGAEDQNSDESLRDTRLFDRNPAIISPVIDTPAQPVLISNNLASQDLTDYLVANRPLRPIPLRRQRIRITFTKDGVQHKVWRTRHVLHIYDKEFQLGTEFAELEPPPTDLDPPKS